MAAHDFANAAPDAVAYNSAAEGLFDAETEAAHRRGVGAKKNGKVGTRSALAGAIDGVELAEPQQPRLARKPEARATRA